MVKFTSGLRFESGAHMGSLNDRWRQRFEQRLMSVREISLTKAGPALVEARVAVELMVAAIYEDAFGSPPPRGDLDSRLSALEGVNAMPRSVLEYFRFVQRLGNIAAHASSSTEMPFSFDEALPGFLSLALGCKWFTNQHEEVRDNLAPIIFDLLQFGRGASSTTPRLAMDLSLRETSLTFDTEHFYERLRRFDIADLVRGEYRSYRWLTVKNVSDHGTRHLTVYEAGENRVRYEQLRIRAYVEAHDGRRLASESLQNRDTPEFVQIFRIFFPHVLAPGDSITVFYSICWPGEPNYYPDVNYSQSLSLHRYRKGVGSVEFSVVDAREIFSAALSLFDIDRFETLSGQRCQMISNDDITDLGSAGESIQKGMKFCLMPPHPSAYRIYVRVEEPISGSED